MRSGYLLFNKIIAATLAAIIFYSYICLRLGNNAIACAVQEATGRPCIGCGLTHGLHEAVLLHFDKARQWNESSLLILAFIVITIFLRLVTSLMVLKASSENRLRAILYSDLTFSLCLYLFCFRHFFTTQIFK
jgi:hypothetical protein